MAQGGEGCSEDQSVGDASARSSSSQRPTGLTEGAGRRTHQPGGGRALRRKRRRYGEVCRGGPSSRGAATPAKMGVDKQISYHATEDAARKEVGRSGPGRRELRAASCRPARESLEDVSAVSSWPRSRRQLE